MPKPVNFGFAFSLQTAHQSWSEITQIETNSGGQPKKGTLKSRDGEK
jgi:hypothetical protein